jgi:hypothetical protein
MTSTLLQASCFWCATGLKVEAGRRYEVALEVVEHLRDADISVDGLHGCRWNWRHEILFAPFNWMRRSPRDPYFALIATVDRQRPERLLPDVPYTAPVTGELVCFFNDMPFAYANNHGSARLHLTPL